MEVTQLKADKANVLNHQAAGRNVLLIVNSHTHSCQDAAWYLRLGSLSAQRFKRRCVCLRCLRLPLTSHFLFKTPSSFLIHYDPSMRPFFFLFPPQPSPKTWLTHTTVACGKMGHALSIIEGVQMPKYRCQWQPNITCLQKRWPAALTCLCYGRKFFLIFETVLIQLTFHNNWGSRRMYYDSFTCFIFSITTVE